ncbi:MAG TPA: ABC transporter substrate-binding protein [Phototrophicaceae bacterium]|jgi:multiple sugar transport system substrate-binding protein|nr:ABC transporter substrate-binding protein [Phototrophicaceae bacterium]
MLNKRVLSGLLMMALVAVFTSGIAAQDKTVIRVWTGSSSPVENDFKTKQVADFEAANPDIDIDLLVSPDYGTQIQTAFGSGDYPEVFTVGQFDFPTLQDSGVIASGEGKIDDVEDIYPNLLAAFSVDGVPYCVPKDFSTLALFYNKDAFDAAGLDYPTADTTWDELYADAEALTDDTMKGMSVAADRNRWLAFYAETNGAGLFDDEGNIKFNSPEAITSLDYYTSFVADGYGATPKDLGTGWNGEAFGSGKAAMTVEGNWAIGYLDETFPDLNWGVAEIPTPEDGEKGTLTFTECWAVAGNIEGAKLDAAWKVVNYFTGKEGAAAVAEAGFGVMPARISAGPAWLEKRGADFEPFVKGADYAWAPVFPLGYADFTDVIDKGFDSVLTGDATPQELLDEAAGVAEEIMAEG